MSQQVRERAEQFIRALHSIEHGEEGAIDRMASMFSENAELSNPILDRINRDRTGREGAREFWSRYRDNFRDIHSDFHQVTANEEAAGLFWTSRGSDPSGQQVQYDGVTLLVFDTDGRIKSFRGYYDTRQLDREVGGS